MIATTELVVTRDNSGGKWFSLNGMSSNYDRSDVILSADRVESRFSSRVSRVRRQASAIAVELIRRGWTIAHTEVASTGSCYFDAIKGGRRCRVRCADHGAAGFLPCVGLRGREPGKVEVGVTTDIIAAVNAVERRAEAMNVPAVA